MRCQVWKSLVRKFLINQTSGVNKHRIIRNWFLLCYSQALHKRILIKNCGPTDFRAWHELCFKLSNVFTWTIIFWISYEMVFAVLSTNFQNDWMNWNAFPRKRAFHNIQHSNGSGKYCMPLQCVPDELFMWLHTKGFCEIAYMYNDGQQWPQQKWNDLYPFL